jgi:hypothetical protein
MIKSQEKHMKQLGLVMLALGIFYWIIGEEKTDILWFFTLSIFFDLRSHMYRIEDKINDLKK